MLSISVDSFVAYLKTRLRRPVSLFFRSNNNRGVPVVKLFLHRLGQVPMGVPLVACVHTSNTLHIKVSSMPILAKASFW